MTDSQQTEIGAKVVMLFDKLITNLGADPSDVNMTNDQKIKLFEKCMVEVGLNFLNYVEHKEKKDG